MDISGISIIIPAYNEEKFLSTTLFALNVARKQSALPTEIIVVDNASTDLTSDVAKSYGAKVIHHEIRNISAVRNRGIHAAQYNLIVSIDADCTTPIDAFPKILKFMNEGQYIGGGLGLVVMSDKIVSRLIVPIIQFCVEQIGGIQGAVFFFLKEEALAIGGFDESRLVAEDSTFSNAMRRHAKLKGKKFGLLKSVKIQTKDRKDTSIKTFAVLALKLFRVFRGQKLTQNDLSYWYNPKR